MNGGWSDFILVNETQRHAHRFLRDDRLDIGRGSSCAISLDDDTVSRRHALLHVTPLALTLDDLHTANGTFVNGKPVSRRVLRIGDLVQVGHSDLRVRRRDWLGDEPPHLLAHPLDASEARERLVAAFVDARHPDLSDAERDLVWWSLYEDWWRRDGDAMLFDEAPRLWSEDTLRRIRAGLDDPARWFLRSGSAAFDALISHLGLGELLGFDVLMTTTNAHQRRHAEQRLEARAAPTHRSLVSYIIGRLDTRYPESEALLGHALHRAMQVRAPLQLETLRELATEARWSRVIESVLFVTFDRRPPVLFRLDAGEPLTLQGVADIDDGERIRVARPAEDNLPTSWAEEFAAHEIVQPFEQL